MNAILFVMLIATGQPMPVLAVNALQTNCAAEIAMVNGLNQALSETGSLSEYRAICVPTRP